MNYNNFPSMFAGYHVTAFTQFFFFFIIFEILPPTSMTGPVSSLVPLSNKFCTILILPWDTWLLIFIVEFFHWDIITSNIN